MARFMPYVHTGLGANVFRQTTDGTPAAGSTWENTNTTETDRKNVLQAVTGVQRVLFRSHGPVYALCPHRPRSQCLPPNDRWDACGRIHVGKYEHHRNRSEERPAGSDWSSACALPISWPGLCPMSTQASEPMSSAKRPMGRLRQDPRGKIRTPQKQIGRTSCRQ